MISFYAYHSEFTFSNFLRPQASQPLKSLTSMSNSPNLITSLKLNLQRKKKGGQCDHKKLLLKQNRKVRCQTIGHYK